VPRRASAACLDRAAPAGGLARLRAQPVEGSDPPARLVAELHRARAGRPRRPGRQRRAARRRWGTTPDDESAIAITGSQHLNKDPPNTGEVLEADIRLNAQNFTFTDGQQSVTPRPGTQLADLEYTLTHELGHVLGFGHSCYRDPKERVLTDDTGEPIPDCDTLQPGDPRLASVMHPTAQGFSGWQLSDDDARGVCTVYSSQVASIPACHRIVTGGCSAAPGGDSWPGASAILLLVLFAFRLRAPPRRGRVETKAVEQ
jgi:hypothetical protein